MRTTPSLASTLPRVPALASVGLLVAAAAASACGSDGDPPACTEATSDALKVCAAGATVSGGADVSTYQGQVDWAAAKKAGIVFAFARVSDGLTHPDDQFTRNWQVMKTYGILRGAYQFFRPAEDPTQQAQMFMKALAAAGSLQAGDLPAVLDVEVTDSVSNATLQANVRTWLVYVEKATGRKPMVYTAQFMSSSLGAGFGAYPLWVANYGVTCPAMPDGWTAWKFWQSSSTGKVSGMAGDVDLDSFNGSLADLRAFAGASADGGASSAVTDGGAAPSDAGLHGADASTDAGGSAGTGAGDAGSPAPIDVDAGATIGSGSPRPASTPDGGTPCSTVR